MANHSGRVLQNMGGGHAGAGPLRETLVLMRELSRGNWTRVPGSLSILLGQLGILKLLFKDNAGEAKALAAALEQKAAKSTAAALAAKDLAESSVKAAASQALTSEATLYAVAADKEKAASAARVAQADIAKAAAARESAAAMEAEGTASKFALTPIGLVAVALIAVGTAAYFLIRHLRKVTEEERKLAEISDFTARKLSDQADAMREAADEAQSYSDWLKKLADDETGLKSAIDEQLESMRERAAFQRQLAQANGATPQQLAQMEIAATQSQLDAVVLAKLKAGRKLEQDLSEAKAAESALESNSTSAQQKSLSEKSAQWKKVVDALEEKVKNEMVIGDIIGTGFEGVPLYGPNRKATASDKFSVNGLPAMSLNEALAKYKGVTAEEDRLKQIQEQLAEKLVEKKKLTEADNKEIRRLQQEEKTITEHLKNQNEFLPQLANARGAGGHSLHGHVSELQSVGAYTRGAVDIARQTLKHVASMDHKMSSGGHGMTGGGIGRVGRVNYGDTP